MRPEIEALLVALLALPSQGPVRGQLTPGRDARLPLVSPTRIAATPAGELLVTDHALRRVCRVDAGGKHMQASFAVGGHPSALGVLGDRVFVGLEDVHRVDIHGLAGRRAGTLGGSGFTIGDPRDLAIDESLERLFVVDGTAHEVKVFGLVPPEGEQIGTIGRGGTLLGEFQNPTGIALDPLTAEVFVADFGTLDTQQRPRVLIFGYDGAFHGVISGRGGPTGQYFGRPQGLVIGSSGHLFVVDSWRGEVVVMERAGGTQVATLGAYGTGSGQLLLPLDALVLGPDEDLFVTSCSGHGVQRFAQGGRL